MNRTVLTCIALIAPIVLGCHAASAEPCPAAEAVIPFECREHSPGAVGDCAFIANGPNGEAWKSPRKLLNVYNKRSWTFHTHRTEPNSSGACLYAITSEPTYIELYPMSGQIKRLENEAKAIATELTRLQSGRGLQ